MPARLQDYVVTSDRDEDDIPTDETIVSFCLFADCDPISYEEAVTDKQWI